jgi:pimeloyl-ACP methyl ester carboxylesterase
MTTEPRELWATSAGVRIEVLEWRPSTPERTWGTAMIGVHGAIGNARGWEAEGVAAIGGRVGGRPRCFAAFSRRGMGGSDVPKTGYGLREFVDETASAVEILDYARFVLFAHSFGVAIAISFAARRPAGLAGLVLGDFPPRYPPLDDIWVQRIEERDRAGETGPLSLHAIRQMRAESQERDLDHELGSIACPVLVLTGDGPDAMLTPDHRERYRRALTDVRFVTIAGAGHMLQVEGRAGPLHDALGAFVARSDPDATQTGSA